MKPEHKRFAELYASGLPAYKSYMEVYPNCTKESAMSCAYKLMKKPEIHDYILEKQKEYYDSLALTPEKIAQKLYEMAFADKDDEIYTPQVAQKALDMLQKQMGLQKQQVKQEIEQKQTIIVTIDEDE